jgi:hypothetical protein
MRVSRYHFVAVDGSCRRNAAKCQTDNKQELQENSVLAIERMGHDLPVLDNMKTQTGNNA